VAKLAVLASGNGGNFEALVRALCARAECGMPLCEGPRHECVLLAYDRKAAFAAERAARLRVPARYVGYYKREAGTAEAELTAALDEAGADLVALAGFMRLLSPAFVASRRGRIVNVHPSLLPAWPGAHAITRAYDAGETEFGVTVHFVDEGMDTGAIIAQEAFARARGESVGEVEARVHEVEHRIYPKAVLALLDGIESERTKQ
jgi:phosphoribosylglycinamide formyltransferase-1